MIHRLAMPALFSMPLSFDAYRQRQQVALERLQLSESWPGLVLMRAGLLGGELLRLLPAEAQSLSRHVVRLPAPYWVRASLHHGGIGTVRHTITALQSALFNAGRSPKALFLAHLTCPWCAATPEDEKILVLRHWETNTKLTAKLQKRPS